MSDLVAGRYPVSEEEWLLDGQPIPPYRRSVNRRDITSATARTLTTATIFAVAVPVQAGDIFNFVSFIVATAPTATVTHSWAAVYNGVGTGAALLAQTADVTSGYVANANKLALTAAASDVAQPGTPQGAAGGPGSWSLVAAGPAVYGVVLYNVTSGTGAILDGLPGGTVAGEVAVTGQVPMVSTGTLATTATAPAVLPTMAAATGGVPYVLLSKQ
jgi:hypothetical protein